MSIEHFFSIAVFFVALIVLTPLLGSYLAKALGGERVFLSPFVRPIEKLIYRGSFIDENEDMTWQRYAKALLCFTTLSLIAVFLLQVLQAYLPFNPENIPAVPMVLAINTAISFVTNTNWQAYAGESTLSYFTQSVGLGVQNFLSAAVGMAVLLAFIRGLMRKNTPKIGNFWTDMVRSILYVLLPLSFILAIVLVSQGVVQNYAPYVKAITLEGESQVLPMGPMASQLAIKQLGTNGGGFLGTNSAHPFENPTPLSNFLQCLALLLIPSSLIYMFGLMTGHLKHALKIFWLVLGVFSVVFLVALWSEYLPNPSLQGVKALEGKELRFSVADSVLWSSATTAASNGSVNAMHDSLSPLTGGLALLQILLGEVIFGGVGSGLYGMLLFVLLTVFLAGLMIGRTPEYLGKKLEAFEMKMVVVALITPSAVTLIGAALSALLPSTLANLGNLGPHGLSEILYAWGSAANNNGSAFAGLSVNNNFFNLGLSAAMLIGRFAVIIPVLAIAGSLAEKKTLQSTNTALATDSTVFTLLLLFMVLLIGALTFFPALALSSIVEHLLMLSGRTF